MTTLSRQLERRRLAASPQRRPGRARLVVRWRVLRGALACLFDRGERGEVEARCVVEIDESGRWRGALEIDGVDPEKLPRSAGADGSIQCDAERGMWHVAAPGFLIATLRPRGDDGWSLLYVRSDAMAKLELAGGRYEAQGATLHEAASPARG